MSEFRAITKTPITFIYISISLIKDNDKIKISSNYNKTIDELKTACVENNMQFIDATKYFIDDFKNTNNAPLGFNNGRILDGHFNAYGHQLISEFIFNTIKSNK